MSKFISNLLCTMLWLLPWLVPAQNTSKTNDELMHVIKSKEEIMVDGTASEAAWTRQSWYQLNHLWLGEPYDVSDFSGRYKLLWRENALYLLVEITDDVLLDRFQDPLMQWWDEDCLEIFIDEDNSGGNHQYNHSAFAYHVDLEGNVVDVNPHGEGKLYNSHVISKRTTKGKISTWEVKIFVFDDTFTDDSVQVPKKLSAGKEIGFALAYCDNDNSEHRENFIGSSKHPGFKQDMGWKDASIFGTILLVED
jgi:hypothetical protein